MKFHLKFLPQRTQKDINPTIKFETKYETSSKKVKAFFIFCFCYHSAIAGASHPFRKKIRNFLVLVRLLSTILQLINTQEEN